MDRRRFLKTALLAAAALPAVHAGDKEAEGGEPQKPNTATAAHKPAQTRLPRWRGFNLQFLFVGSKDTLESLARDVKMIADLGFDFVRFPLWYTKWTDGGDPYKVKEPVLEEIDRAVELALDQGLHVDLNFHRAPGYCVAFGSEREPFNLWTDKAAEEAFCFHWGLFARRYKNIPPQRLSFDLVNEPAAPSANYQRVVRAAVKEIRAVDPDRLIIADGLYWGIPVPELSDLGIAQSCRGYWPYSVSHYKASWFPGSEFFSEPVWPGSKFLLRTWDRKALEEFYRPWAELARKGVGVHCGECGCHNQTPHGVFLAWFRDVLEILTGHGVGYALWNFRGSFGILDSERKDVEYEDWHGHKLDRKLLDLIQEF